MWGDQSVSVMFFIDRKYCISLPYYTASTLPLNKCQNGLLAVW